MKIFKKALIGEDLEIHIHLAEERHQGIFRIIQGFTLNGTYVEVSEKYPPLFRRWLGYETPEVWLCLLNSLTPPHEVPDDLIISSNQIAKQQYIQECVLQEYLETGTLHADDTISFYPSIEDGETRHYTYSPPFVLLQRDQQYAARLYIPSYGIYFFQELNIRGLKFNPGTPPYKQGAVLTLAQGSRELPAVFTGDSKGWYIHRVSSAASRNLLHGYEDGHTSRWARDIYLELMHRRFGHLPYYDEALVESLLSGRSHFSIRHIPTDYNLLEVAYVQAVLKNQSYGWGLPDADLEKLKECNKLYLMDQSVHWRAFFQDEWRNITGISQEDRSRFVSFLRGALRESPCIDSDYCMQFYQALDAAASDKMYEWGRSFARLSSILKPSEAFTIARDYLRNYCIANACETAPISKDLMLDHDIWAERVALMHSDLDLSVVKDRDAHYLDERDGWAFTPLTSIRELYDEGIKMEHCVASYGQRVLEGSSIISVTKGRNAATLEIRDSKLVQHSTYRNAPIRDKDLWHAIEKWCSEKGVQL